MTKQEIIDNATEGATYYKPLNWWYCGWYSLYQWRHVLWQMDEFGNAVVVSDVALRFFNNVDAIVEVV